MLKKILVGFGIAAIGAGLGYYLYKEYQLVKNWDFQLVGVSLLNYTSSNATLQLTFKIINVSNVEAEISKINGSVTANGIYMGTVYQNDTMNIPAQGYNLLTLNAAIDTNNLVNTVIGVAAQGPTAQMTIMIDGTMLIKSGFLGITIPITDTEVYTLNDILQ